MQISKDEIVNMLRDRGDQSQADQAEQKLPDQVDTEEHSDLLGQVGVDPAQLLGDLGKSFDL